MGTVETQLNQLSFADVDRELIAQGGFAEFMRLAWPNVEPAHLSWNWHIDAVAEHLAAVAKGQITNLLILEPPGCMKTLSVSVFWPAWLWAEVDASTKFIFSSYAQGLSDKSAKQHRDLVKSNWYQSIYGDRVRLGADQVAQVRFFENERKGFRFSTSVGGVVTGYHGDVLVFDDLAKSQDATGKAVYDPVAIHKANEFWFSTMSTRQANPKTTRRVGIMQRLHHDDTAARCIASGQYEVLTLPMEYERKRAFVSCLGWSDPRTEDGELLWPGRFDRAGVDKLKADLGPTTSAAQLEQRPTPAGGVIFKRESFRYWGEPGSLFETRPDEGVMVSSWDCAFKGTSDSDPVAGHVWLASGANVFLLDRSHGHRTFTQTLNEIRAQWAQWRGEISAVLVEAKANGEAVMDTLRDEIPGIVGVNPEGGKVVRANAVQAMFEAGQVWFPPRDSHPWIADVEAEALAFPYGANDDDVDALTQALIYLRTKSAASFIAAWGDD